MLRFLHLVIETALRMCEHVEYKETFKAFLASWRQTFNATDMSTMYPYADHNTIPAAFIN